MTADTTGAAGSAWTPGALPVEGPGPDGDVRPGDVVTAISRLIDDPSLLQMVAQPLVDLASGHAAGYELLARVPAAWAIPPDVLFAQARDLGCSPILHRRVATEALRLRRTLPDNTFLSINIDPVDLADKRVLAALLAENSLARVVVEVTEHAWPDDHAPIDDAIQTIRDLGGLIAADDVGAGYAGLNQLMRIRPDFVKVDRELVANLGHDPAAEALITAVGQLSGSLNAWVIVEGVETEVQLATLSRLNVPLGQGWLLGRPQEPWPDPVNTDIIQAQATRNAIPDTIWSLLRPVSHTYTRRHAQFYREHINYPALALAPTASLGDAVTRALSRPPGTRWHPILITSDDGTVLGEASIEDLVMAINTAHGALRAVQIGL